MSALKHLDLKKNSIVGSLPDEIGDLEKLSELHLSGNNLTGKIPTALANCKELSTLGEPASGIIEASNLEHIAPTFLTRHAQRFTPRTELQDNEGLNTALPKTVKALPKLGYLHLNSGGLQIKGKLAEDAKALQACWQSIGGDADELLNEAEDDVTKWKGITVVDGRVTKLGKPQEDEKIRRINFF